jgi:uncharacterized YccA/Bax inhibitor family protein
MRSGNPALSDNTFLDVGSGELRVGHADAAMTLEGTVNKTSVLLALVLLGAFFCWQQFDGPESVARIMPLALGAGILGLVLALVTVFKKTWSPITAPIYALVEGVFLGGISAIFEAQYPGIVMQAAGLTFATLAAMLMAYRSGMIKATENFKLGVVAATGAIFLLYVANFVAGLFGYEFGLIHDSGWMGIGFSLVVVSVAALNLVLDFDFIETGVDAGAPKYMEWYGAFGLILTLVWLYIEMLRLLAKLQSRE